MLYNNPTPLEQAYASFLLKNHVSPLPISGRDAVLFLTKSNLCRSLLRECWNVVDPQHDGKLFSEHQWWTLLKLVALAQQSSYTTNDVQALLHKLYTPCALPVFDTVIIPSSSVLLQQYGSVPAEFNVSPQKITSLSSALDELGPLEDAPLPSLQQAVQVEVENKEEDDDDFGDFEAPPVVVESSTPDVIPPVAAVEPSLVPEAPVDFDSPRELHSLSSALEELGEIQDKPLPSLNIEQAVDTNKGDDDDFGDFEAPPTASLPVAGDAFDSNGRGEASLPVRAERQHSNTNDVFFTAIPAVVPLSSALDELGSTQDAPLSSLDTFGAAIGDTNQQQQQDEEDDDFGEFEDAPVGNEPNQGNEPSHGVEESFPVTAGEPQDATADAFSNSAPAVVPLSSALDELGSTEDAPLPSLDAFGAAVNDTDKQQQEDDDFGDFETPSLEVTADATAEASTPAVAPLSSALDDLGSMQDAPLPSLDAFGAAFDDTDKQQEVDDDFGDFEDAPMGNELPQKQESTTEASFLESSSTKEFVGGFGEPSVPAVVPLASALDELGSSHDAPLPSLDAFAAAVGEEQQDENGEVDEFGDFDAPQHPALVPDGTYDWNDPLSSALDSLGPIEDAPLPSLDAVNVPADVDDTDDFGDFEAPSVSETAHDTVSTALDTKEAVIPPLDSEQPKQIARDAFSGFQETASHPLGLSSALDELGSTDDAPLPSLDTFAATFVVDEQPEHREINDDFGDFDDARTGPTSSEAPFPSLDTKDEPQEQAEDVEDDDFGDFADAPAIDVPADDGPQEMIGEFDAAGDSEKHGDPLSAAFESLGPLQDAPLPSLECYPNNIIQEPSNHGDDEFGDFEAPMEIGKNSDAELQGIESSEPLSSPLDTVDPSQDAPLPSLDAAYDQNGIHQSNDNPFGDFEDAPKVEITAEPDQMAEIPPPPLDDEGVNVEQKQVPENNDNVDDPFASAFDSIAPIENSPLPPLGLHKTASSEGDAEAEDTEETSDFGDFEDAPVVEPPSTASASESVRVGETDPTNGEPTDDETTPDDSDPFSAAFDTIAPVQDGPLPSMNAAASKDANDEPEDTEFQPTGAGDDYDDDDDDDFGDFEDAAEAKLDEDVAFDAKHERCQDDNVATREIPQDNLDDTFSAFDGPADAPLPALHSTSGSDFSGFETASENVASEEKNGETELLPPPIGGDSSDFSEPQSSIPVVTTSTEDVQDEAEAETQDDFGDFTAVVAPVAEDTGAFDADWGDFEEPTPLNAVQAEDQRNEAVIQDSFQPSFDADFGATAPPAVIEQEVGDDDEFGDFDSFQQVEHPVEKEDSLDDIKSRIHEMQKKLSIRTSSGGNIDYSTSFVENSGDQSSGWFNKKAQKAIDDGDLLQRARRCCQIMSLLTESHGETVLHWEKLMNVARDELAMGSFLLEEAKSLKGEKVVLSALGKMVAGLGEYVRVIRSIASTLCDLLGVDVTMNDKEPLKNRIVLLDSALEIEDLWATVQQTAKSLGLDIPSIDSISAIRCKCLSLSADDTNFCQLTLQPLLEEDKDTTWSPVEWDGKDYMACGANFWANRISPNPPA